MRAGAFVLRRIAERESARAVATIVGAFATAAASWSAAPPGVVLRGPQQPETQRFLNRLLSAGRA